MQDLPDARHHLELGGMREQKKAVGGARRGSGRPKQKKAWVRSEPVRVLFRQAEYDQIDELARIWDVPVATAVWALTVDGLQERTGKRARKLVQISPREQG